MSIKDFIFRFQRRRRRHKKILNAERDFHLSLLPLGKGNVTIDAGANVGIYTQFLARTGATVHAFEPDPIAFDELRKRTATLPNVVLHQAAVGAEKGESLLFRTKDFHSDPIKRSVGSSLIEGHRLPSKSNSLRVEVISLPDFIESLGVPVDILKMDVEGAEVEILEAMIARNLTHQVKRAYIETHEATHKNLQSRTFKIIRYAEGNLPNWNLDWA